MEGFQPPTSSFVASCGMRFRHMSMVRTEVFTGYSSTSPQHWEHSVYIHQHFHHCICIYKEFHHFHILDLPPTPLTASYKIYECSIRPVSGLYPGAVYGYPTRACLRRGRAICACNYTNTAIIFSYLCIPGGSRTHKQQILNLSAFPICLPGLTKNTVCIP